ncbi:hypothetical protein J2X02_002932 [Pseudoxanthomonas japonensis]|uniref:Uncharacterized protein n=1 Tax=Archangium gephyra TaxID=48 RepID=A0A2W5U1Y5_9BACT|nr:MULTISPECIES: DUF6445 family protein [Pseudoxanthomonas]MBA3930006.1 hypothetical protein [Xanthomonas sp.]MDR7070081.1 hypothetical protein [Pseudoxanthomonas japonensis]PZR02628.1 MAG: hypothetical protein DI536_36820 [Archangium gephyra]
MFNPRPAVQQLAIGHGHVCVVIDDALLAPERLPAFAEAYREDFQPAPPAVFPGLHLRMPEEFTDLLHDVLRDHARRALGMRRVLRSASRLAMVTTPVSQLAPPHWQPRRARAFAPDQGIAVAELFLFQDPALGGTHFFVPRVSPQQVEQLEHDADALSPEEFSLRHALVAGYPQASSWCFTHTLTVPARWNRLLIHDGGAFRAPAITAPPPLAPDPRHHRLTLQATLACSRHRVSW